MKSIALTYHRLTSLIFSFTFVILFVFYPTSYSLADETAKTEKPLRIAVASNFAPILKELLIDFNQTSKIKTQVITASSGTLFLQIKHGAPFDIFLSADASRPQQLLKQGYAVENSLKTYAYGRLALYSASDEVLSMQLLSSSNIAPARFAIANPKLAPYGVAAKQALKSLGVWEKYQKHLIMGMNVNQTYQQVRSQAVNMGLVAYSQLILNNEKGILIPDKYFQPIKQQMIIIKKLNDNIIKGEQKSDAQKFSEFIMSDATQNKIASFGYNVSKNRITKSSITRNKTIQNKATGSME